MTINATTIVAPAEITHHSHCGVVFLTGGCRPNGSDTERGSDAPSAASSAFNLAASSISLATGSPRVLLEPPLPETPLPETLFPATLLPATLLPPAWPDDGTPVWPADSTDRCKSLGGLLAGEPPGFAAGDDGGVPDFGSRTDEPRG